MTRTKRAALGLLAALVLVSPAAADSQLGKYAYRVLASGTFECPLDVICTPPPPDAAPDKGRIKHQL